MAPRLARGIELFNRREFFECHEVLETEWTRARGARRLFLQALIHLAVGFHHHQQGNCDGRDRQLDKGLGKLAGYLPTYEGIDTAGLYERTIAWRERGGEHPRIRGIIASP
jgi:hypothetical protein